jgi:hypothetical protein
MRKAPHAIVPDIHAYKFPSGVQRADVSGPLITDEVIFELKAYTACLLCYGYNNIISEPVD